VRTERLSDYVSEPVDFLKLNIEGDELPVLLDAEASGALRNVREIVVEYHDWATSEQQLATLLDLLRREGFRYRTRDWDGPLTRPGGVGREWGRPWSCLVGARRIDAPFSPRRTLTGRRGDARGRFELTGRPDQEKLKRFRLNAGGGGASSPATIAVGTSSVR
jgi:hypothetical protein